MSHTTLTLNTPQTTAINHEHAFIAADIPDKETLIDGIHPRVEVTILDPNRDAIEQITETLKGKQYSVIHIISHGAPGQIQLGKTPLNLETLPQYIQQLQQWRESLTENAEILIYGCNVAATDTQQVNGTIGQSRQTHHSRQTHQSRQTHENRQTHESRQIRQGF